MGAMQHFRVSGNHFHGGYGLSKRPGEMTTLRRGQLFHPPPPPPALHVFSAPLPRYFGHFTRRWQWILTGWQHGVANLS